MNKIIIGFCGMTHLGICSASASISKGYHTICYDKNEQVINDLKQNIMPIKEPFINDVFIEKEDLCTFTNYCEDLKKCDVVYVAPDIQTNDYGESNLEELEEILDTIIEYVNSKAVLVILSQVPPGFTKKYTSKFKLLYYQVETLIFGEAYNRAILPERCIIGCKNPDAPLPATFTYFLDSFNCPIIKMNYQSAEFCKISINMCLISSITIANKMAEICENIGANWNEIKPALKLDKRIGKHSYINAQLGISGGNLERDITSTIKIAKKFNLNTDLMENFFQISNQRKNWVFDVMQKFIFPKIKNPQIAVLGLSYKNNTNSLKNAPSLMLLNHLKNNKVIAYDPVVNVKDFAPWCEQAKTIKDAFLKSDVIIVLTPWEEIIEVTYKMLNKKLINKYFIDPLNIFEKKKFSKLGIEYFSIGNSIKKDV